MNARSAATCWIEGRPATAAELGAAALVNYGHFTTMQVRVRKVRGLDLHLQRLDAANRELFGVPLEAGGVRAAATAALDAAGLQDASVRITLFPRDIADDDAERLLMVSTAPPRSLPAQPARVRGVAHERHLPHLKHVGMFDLLQLRAQARREGDDDVLLVDRQGRITEGSTWNIGLHDGETVCWPQGAALRGVAERLLQAGLAARGVPQRSLPVRTDGLRRFRAAFLCNSCGVRPIGSIDGHAFAGVPGLTALLDEVLLEAPPQPL